MPPKIKDRKRVPVYCYQCVAGPDLMQVEVEDLDLLVACLDGEYFATDDTCSHEEASWGIPAGTDATCDSAGSLVAPCRIGTLSCSSGAWAPSCSTAC